FILICNVESQRGAWKGLEQFIHHPRHQGKSGNVRIDPDAGSKSRETPFQKSLFDDRAVNEFQRVLLGEAKPLVAECKPMSDGKLFEVALSRVANLRG